MKGFFATLLVLCGLGAAAWYFHDPYLEPLLKHFGSGSDLGYEERIIDNPGAAKPAAPVPDPRGEKPDLQVETTPGKPTPAAAPSSKPKSELEELLEVRYPMPPILPLLTIVDQWRTVPPTAFPSQVVAKETITFQLVINGQVAGSSNVAPGTPLSPVSLTGDQLVVASLANPGMTTRLHVDKTDFKERIESRYQQFVDAKRKEVEAKRQRARQMISADPARLALLRGDAPASPDSSEDARFNTVKESLERGEVASVKLSEARSFRWNGEETVGGQFAGTYNTVTVSFEVKTIFGEFPVEYKCLLQGSRVVAWIDPVTEDRV